MLATVTEFRAAIELGDGLHYILSDDRGISSMSREARQSFARGGGREHTGAAAVVIGSRIGEIIGNFFIHIGRPVYPTCMFTGDEDAVKWLNSQRREKR